jgi:hypothetical protein
MSKHSLALDALRLALLNQLDEARANVWWSRGAYDDPSYRARSIEIARGIIAQIRALGAVRRAANEAELVVAMWGARDGADAGAAQAKAIAATTPGGRW